MIEQLPDRMTDKLDWDWSNFKPFADQLLAEDITADTIESWLSRYSRLSTVVDELGQRLYVATTVDTNDEQANQRFENFNNHILPEIMTVSNQLDKKLVASGLVPAGMEIPIRNVKADLEIFCEENLPLISQEMNLIAEYDRIIGAQTIVWDGEELTLPQVTPVFFEQDRERREKAFRLTWERRLEDADALNDLWGKFMNIRKQIAQNAGMADYRDYMWKKLKRFDYTPDDALAFFDAVEEVISPAAERIRERRREKLGYESLRPWDTSVDVLGRDPLKPYDNVNTLVDKSVDIFTQVDPELGEYMRTMRDEGYLDLDNRKGKAPGGYCTYFPLSQRPFIFMNSVGLHEDIQTMLHEAGHAFHAFSFVDLPYYHQLNVPMEFSEVASMAMELLGSAYLTIDKGGFYTPAESARTRIEHLEDVMSLLPYIALVASFQHWIYTHIDEAMDTKRCDDEWERLWNRFMRGVDYSGLEAYKRFYWRRQVHIFCDPFYYIEYGLAQLGAIQVWANSLSDHAGTLKQYRQALKLGGTVSLRGLYAVVGAKLAFDSETLQRAVALIEKTLNELEALQGS